MCAKVQFCCCMNMFYHLTGVLAWFQASQPSYALKRICFVDADEDTAEALASAVVEASVWADSRKVKNYKVVKWFEIHGVFGRHGSIYSWVK